MNNEKKAEDVLYENDLHLSPPPLNGRQGRVAPVNGSCFRYSTYYLNKSVSYFLHVDQISLMVISK